MLNDEDGVRVPAIETSKHHDPVGITEEILRQWLTGRGATPVTWRTLLVALRDTKLIVLAQDIEEVLYH